MIRAVGAWCVERCFQGGRQAVHGVGYAFVGPVVTSALEDSTG